MNLSRLLILAVFSFPLSCASTPGPDPSPPPPTATVSSTAPPPSEEPSTGLADIEAAIKANDGERARKLAAEAISQSPKNPKTHYYAGVGAELTGDKDAAEQHYRKALSLAPSFSDAAVNLSALLLDKGKATDAVAILKPLATKAPDDALLQTNLATAYAAAGDQAAAAEVYAGLMKKEPSPETRLGYARALIALGKKEEAAAILREGVARAGDNRDLYAAFGADLAKAGAYDDAIKAMDRAIQIKPGADLYTYRALFKRSQKNNDGARVDLEAALKENPRFAAAHFYLGELFEAMQKPSDARKAYEKAAELEPESPRGKKARERVEALKKK
ncbi:MAG: tetratricopeptide repeat protein [Myxococcales bacterium]|nr:tetratricopeptide repeat protein [Polyangiaceae bacterium]MDW8250234.1 tetratricopeptide repeat protein [Myxococcales bacterium]